MPRAKWDAILKEVHPQAPASFSDYREAANKLSAQITYSRVDYAAAESLKPSQEVTSYILGYCGTFPERTALCTEKLVRSSGHLVHGSSLQEVTGARPWDEVRYSASQL